MGQLVDRVPSRWHVVDRPIGQDEQDWVLSRSHDRLRILFEFFKNGSEVCRATESNRSNCMFVSFNYVMNARDVGVRRVAIDCKAMADIVQSHVTRYSTEAEYGEASIVVVRLNNLANIVQGLLVLICKTFTIKVKRAHLARVAIRGGVVDGGDEGDLPARPQVIHERGPRVDLE